MDTFLLWNLVLSFFFCSQWEENIFLDVRLHSRILCSLWSNIAVNNINSSVNNPGRRSNLETSKFARSISKNASFEVAIRFMFRWKSWNVQPIGLYWKWFESIWIAVRRFNKRWSSKSVTVSVHWLFNVFKFSWPGSSVIRSSGKLSSLRLNWHTYILFPQMKLLQHRKRIIEKRIMFTDLYSAGPSFHRLWSVFSCSERLHVYPSGKKGHAAFSVDFIFIHTRINNHLVIMNKQRGKLHSSNGNSYLFGLIRFDSLRCW